LLFEASNCTFGEYFYQYGHAHAHCQVDNNVGHKIQNSTEFQVLTQ